MSSVKPAGTQVTQRDTVASSSGEARQVDSTQGVSGRRDLFELDSGNGKTRFILVYKDRAAAEAALLTKFGPLSQEVVEALERGDGAAAVRATEELTTLPLPAPILAHILAQQAAGHRMLRDFDNMVGAAQKAVAVHRTDTTLHTLALALKNAGRIDEAAAKMGEASALSPKSVEIGIAHAGYLVLAGKVDEGRARFAAIPRTAADAQAYDMNAAWFAAISGDAEGLVKHLANGAKHDAQAALVYARDEVDFDPYRKTRSFAALVAKLERLVA